MSAALSFVIPCYRSAQSLPLVVEALHSSWPAAEIVLVCDCSPDDTWAVIERLADVHSHHITACLLGHNAGQHNALLCGIRLAKGNTIVTLDDDGQHPPEAIRQVLDRLTPDVDLVYGVPSEEQHSFFRNATSVLGKALIQKLTGSQQTSALRVFRGHLKVLFDAYHGHACSVDVLLSWGTSRIVHQMVEFRERRFGTSNYTTRKLLCLAIAMVTGYSVWPLKMAVWIGFLSTALGFVIFIYVLWNYFFLSTPVQGFTFLAASISMFAGLQMFCMGVMGEYLARMYYRVIDRPPFIIRSVRSPTFVEGYDHI